MEFSGEAPFQLLVSGWAYSVRQNCRFVATGPEDQCRDYRAGFDDPLSGMDIGTAKATPEQQAIVPHHLINVTDPNQDYSLSEYVSAAEGVCREIVGRGRTPLFVGGTGLYLRGVLRGVFEGPPADWSLRSRFEALSTEHGPGSCMID